MMQKESSTRKELTKSAYDRVDGYYCPDCNGTGWWQEVGNAVVYQCKRCGGWGAIPFVKGRYGRRGTTAQEF